MNSKRLFSTLALLLVLILTFTACGTTTATSAASATTANAAATTKAATIVTAATTAGGATTAPTSALIIKKVATTKTGTDMYAGGKKPKVALLMAKSTSPYSGAYFKLFKQLAPNYPDTEWIAFDAQSDATLQAQQADEAIAMGANLIMVQPVDNLAFVSSAKKIKEKNILLVVANTALHESGNDYITAFYGPDCYVEGQLAADMAHNAGLDGKSYVHLGQNDTNSTGRLRKAGFVDRNKEKGYGFISLEESPDCDFSVEKSKGHMSTFLTKYPGKIDFVNAIDDCGAYGALQAIQADATGMNSKIKIISAAGGQAPNLDALKTTDNMVGLIYQGPKYEITGAMEFVHGILQGNLPVNKNNCMELPIVTKENVAKFEVAY